MNPMLTRFPESVRIDGVRYPLNPGWAAYPERL